MLGDRGMSHGLTRRHFLRASVGVGAGLLLAGCGVQGGTQGGGGGGDYPSRPVEMIVPFPPGGSSDLIGRAFAQAMEEPMGQPMVVVNREGANGAVGVREAINSAPDGYRLALSSYSLFTVTPLLVQNAETVALDDLRIITGLAAESVLLLANADGPYQTLDDLLAAGESGENLSFSHSGPGGGLQCAQLVFFNQAGIEATEVPFDGSTPALTALLGDQVDISASEIAGCVEQVEAGDLVPLGIFTEERSPFVPDVPTMQEQGFDYSIVQGRLMVGPKDMPDDVVNQLVDYFGQAGEGDELTQTLEDNYVTKRVNSAEAMQRFLTEARESNASIINELGIEPQEAS